MTSHAKLHIGPGLKMGASGSSCQGVVHACLLASVCSQQAGVGNVFPALPLGYLALQSTFPADAPPPFKIHRPMIMWAVLLRKLPMVLEMQNAAFSAEYCCRYWKKLVEI